MFRKVHLPTGFKRDGNNLYASVDLDLYTAMLGGEITIETFKGKVNLKIPPETSRINVGHFMADLITNVNIWNNWRGQMPVIYNKASS